MAVSAYASLVSLTHVLDNLHYRAQFRIPRADLKQVEMLQGNVHSLLEFVELHSGRKSTEIEGLWKGMVEVAFEAENTINFHVVTQLHTISQGETSDPCFSAFCEDMETLISKFCNIKEKLSMTKEEGEDAQIQKAPSAFVPIGGSSAASSSITKTAIGIDEHVDWIMAWLTSNESKLQILPIVGMGGIGKTTLAKNVFDHPDIDQHFDICIWLTLSKENNIEQVLTGLLEKGNRGTCESAVKSGEALYQKLFGRRYLIAMDDVWTTRALDDLRIYFPKDENGSRIILTTRLSNVAVSLGSQNIYPLNFLDEEKSWELFCQNAFAQIGCPSSEIEEIGKKIVKGCRGLPLEIVVIGQLLAKSNMTREYWECVAKTVGSLEKLEDDKHCLKVLSLSYESLPIYLKPCFLFMRTFREDATIEVWDLTRNWIVEGFIKQLSDRSLEETADEYVKELIDRNLMFRRNAEKFGMHDLLRDLCLRESENEHFILSPRVQSTWYDGNLFSFCNRHLKGAKSVVQIPHLVNIYASASEAFLCDGCKREYSHITRPIFVKVMERFAQPIELRYSKMNFYGANTFFSRPLTLYLLWNLQFLTIHYPDARSIALPHDIWNMPQLRHIRVSDGCHLTNPVATHIVGADFIVLKSLQSLSKVLNFNCTKDTLARIPNLKNLDLGYTTELEAGMEWSIDSLCDLAQLQKLESLKLQANSLMIRITFPKSLKTLSLHNSQMAWEDISVLGSLPSLESLTLRGIKGSEWNPTEGEFLRLKQLHILATELACWGADESHFPILQWLRLDGLHHLKDIPLGIGDIPTLQSMELIDCNESVYNSAKEIWKEQESLGHESLQIHIVYARACYQIDSVHARMTNKASVARVRLTNILETLQKAAQHCHLYHLNANLTETVECIHFLQDFVEIRCQSKSQELESLWKEIDHVYKSSDSLNFQGRPSDFPEILERVMERLALIRMGLSVGEEEGQEDVEAGTQNLCIDVAEKDTIRYQIKSMKLENDDTDS